MTEWGEFRDLDLAALACAMTTPVLVDGRNLFDPAAARAAGFDYAGIGRPSSRRAQAYGHAGAAAGSQASATI